MGEKMNEHVAPPVIDIGVHFSMPEEVYHSAAALGSGDMKRAFTDCASYWFESPLNPMREQDDPATPAQIFGRAVHTNVLEGRAKFERLYAPTEHPGNVKAGKIEREEIAAAGKTPLKRADFDRIQQAAAMIRGNPHLAEAFVGGQPEVSVFWTANGVPKKARFDYLKKRAIVDLKSLRNSRAIPFHEACKRAIAEWRYHYQAAHYLEGREAMRRLIGEGKVFGGADIDPDFMFDVARNAEYAFVFVFFQAEGAPLSAGYSISPGNPILDIARSSLAIAEDNYRKCVERFGLDTPWITAEPIAELFVDDLPPWARG